MEKGETKGKEGSKKERDCMKVRMKEKLVEKRKKEWDWMKKETDWMKESKNES